MLSDPLDGARLMSVPLCPLRPLCPCDRVAVVAQVVEDAKGALALMRGAGPLGLQISDAVDTCEFRELAPLLEKAAEVSARTTPPLTVFAETWHRCLYPPPRRPFCPPPPRAHAHTRTKRPKRSGRLRRARGGAGAEAARRVHARRGPIGARHGVRRQRAAGEGHRGGQEDPRFPRQDARHGRGEPTR